VSGRTPWRGRPFDAFKDRGGRREFVILAVLFICAGGLLVFLGIVNEAMEGDARRLDRALLLALRGAADPGDPVGPRWLELAMRDLTALGGYPVIVTIAVLAVGFLAILRDRAAVLLVLAALVGGILLNEALKGVFDRPRPDLVAHLVQVETPSLPSAHAMMAAVTYLTLGAVLARAQPRPARKMYILGAAIVLTLLIGFSRVYLGVHWPTDVLAGWTIGAAWAMACCLVARLATRQAAAPEPPEG
jgi:undecaprenyl-diphosphatase